MRLPGWLIGVLCLLAGVCEDDGGGGATPPSSAIATISIAPDAVDEGNVQQSATVVVQLDAPVTGDVTVGLATEGHAVAGEDYSLADSELTVAAGQTQAETLLTPILDVVDEGPEQVEIRIDGISSTAPADEVIIGEPSTARLTILDAGRFPNAKAALAPDLLAFAGDLVITTDGSVRFHPNVYNWGAVRSTPTRLLVAVNDQPDWSGPAVATREINVPAIDAKGGLQITEELRLDTLRSFSPEARDYYVLFHVDEVAGERPGRSYTNQDFLGFSLDADGRVVLRCRPSATGTADLGAADPFAAEQWHLVNSGQQAYARSGGTPGEDLGMAASLTAGPTGRGVKLAIVDDGLELCHPDLAANIEAGASYNFNAADNLNTAEWAGARRDDPLQPSTLGGHGTSVAGVAAAAMDNGIGGRGVAPEVRLRGYNLLAAIDWQSAFPDALGASPAGPDSTDVDVFNLSFGSLGGENNADPDSDVSVFRNGVRNLRQGRGAIYVKAAGNGFNACRSLHRSVNNEIGCVAANGDALNNLPYLVVVGGFNAAGRKASYASAGANLWVSAPSGEFGGRDPAIITTDQMGVNRGYDNLVELGLAVRPSLNPDGHYVSTFNGTSASSPAAAAAVALLLEAGPRLTWRDVKHILAKTARKIDPEIPAVRYGFGGVAYTMQLPWVTNAAGYHFHNWYGFGAVHVDDALAFAASHQPDSLGEFRETQAFTSGPGSRIPDHDGGGLTATMNVGGLPANASIEAVTLEIDVTHPFTNDLGIHLISPSGTESVLNPAFNEILAGDANLDWQLLSNAFYGEAPNGEWRLKVVDAAPGDAGRLNRWSLRFALGTHP